MKAPINFIQKHMNIELSDVHICRENSSYHITFKTYFLVHKEKLINMGTKSLSMLEEKYTT